MFVVGVSDVVMMCFFCVACLWVFYLVNNVSMMLICDLLYLLFVCVVFVLLVSCMCVPCCCMCVFVCVSLF